jgi:hypothetical protein
MSVVKVTIDPIARAAGVHIDTVWSHGESFLHAHGTLKESVSRSFLLIAERGV